MSLSTMLCNLRLDSCVFDPFKADEGPAQAVKSSEPHQKQECAAMSAEEAGNRVLYYYKDDPSIVIEGSLLEPCCDDTTNAVCFECRFYLKEDGMLNNHSIICTRRGEAIITCDEVKTCSYFKRKDVHENNR